MRQPEVLAQPSDHESCVSTLSHFNITPNESKENRVPDQRGRTNGPARAHYFFGVLTFKGEKSFKARGSSSFSGIKKIKGNSPGLEQRGNYLPVLERTFLLLLAL